MENADIRFRDLAHSLDCLTEGDLQVLAGCTPLTAEAWRKRGTGPDYIRLGNNYLYPRKAMAEFLAARVRVRPTPSMKGQL